MIQRIISPTNFEDRPAHKHFSVTTAGRVECFYSYMRATFPPSFPRRFQIANSPSILWLYKAPNKNTNEKMFETREHYLTTEMISVNMVYSNSVHQLVEKRTSTEILFLIN